MDNNKSLSILANSKATIALSNIGFAGGLYYAFKKDCGFWGYMGYAFLGSIALGAVGTAIDVTVLKK